MDEILESLKINLIYFHYDECGAMHVLHYSHNFPRLLRKGGLARAQIALQGDHGRLATQTYGFEEILGDSSSFPKVFGEVFHEGILSFRGQKWTFRVTMERYGYIR